MEQLRPEDFDIPEAYELVPEGHAEESGLHYRPWLVPDYLPNDPAELLRLTAADLKQYVLGDKEVELCMSVWFRPLEKDSLENECSVCLAGALMLGSLNAPKRLNGVKLAGAELSPERYKKATMQKLKSLDWFRSGDIESLILATTTASYGFATSMGMKFREAYRKRYGKSHYDEDRYWNGKVNSSDIPGLIARLKWSARWIDDNIELY